MKRRISSTLMALVLCLTLLPAAAYAAGGTAVYVSSSGNDGTGDGSADKPFATLAKAVDAADDGATIYVMSDLTMTAPPFQTCCNREKIVILTKLTLAGKPALCYNFPVASAGFYRSCKYDPYPVERGERLSSKSANIPEPHRIPPEPGSRMGLKRNRVERRYRFMKCKRLCA